MTRGPRGCDVARRATWQRHAGPRSAHVAREYIIYIYRLHNIKSLFVLPL